MRKIRKGDDVVVTTGRDRGKRGTVLRIVDAEHVVVEGANRVKKHQRPNPMKGMQGGIIEKELPISAFQYLPFHVLLEHSFDGLDPHDPNAGTASASATAT